jgi:hypothetical protein
VTEYNVGPDALSIYSGVPVPDTAARHSYPFGRLEIGQNFYIEYEDRKHVNSIRSSAHGWNQKQKRDGTGAEVVVRRVPGQESLVGIWRIS